MTWALKKDGKELERHSTKTACVTAAIERRLAVRSSFDFASDGFESRIQLIEGVEITKSEGPA